MAPKWDGLYLGRRKGNDLIYAGKVDHGFDNNSAKEPQTRLKPGATDDQCSTRTVVPWERDHTHSIRI
jgi:bifunctional non-homologous end joining protein LigD